MRIVVQVSDTIKDPRAIATIARGFLMGVILNNRLLIRAGLVPPLYSSGVKFRPEPWAGKIEEFADALTAYRRGWADCDDLVPWRCAEIIEAGGMALPKIYWRRKRDGGLAFHVECRHYARKNGRWVKTDKVEDVSRFLGMADEPAERGTFGPFDY